MKWFEALLLAVACTGGGAREPPRTVVFVCEHGSAKSVLAAALFNDAAARRGLPWHAVARGLEPDPALAPSVVRGLTADGLPLPQPVPIALAAGDRRADRLVFIGDPTRSPGGEVWSDVPAVSSGYARARDVLRADVARLLDQLPE